MLNLSLNELKVIVKSRGIKDYKSMSEDRLLSALNASESVEKSEKNLDDTDSPRNEDSGADKVLKTTKINKTAREVRKGNRDGDKISRDGFYIWSRKRSLWY